MNDLSRIDHATTIAMAVTDVMSEVRRLKRADNNAFAKYRYTSIDDFKDAMRPILARCGLSVSMKETECDFVEVKNDKDKATPYLRFTFSLTLEHTSGQKADPEDISVVLPFVGAQTTGQARSYAMKEWLKSRFLASSGDSEDADQHDTSEELSKAEARPLYAELQEELRKATLVSLDAMKEWVERRRASIDVLPKDWRLQLQRIYKEGMATRKAQPESPAFNAADFLAEVEETLARASSPDEAEQFFDEMDVQSSLSGDEAALARAFELKAARLRLLSKQGAH